MSGKNISNQFPDNQLGFERSKQFAGIINAEASWHEQALQQALNRCESMALECGVKIEIHTDFHHLAGINKHLDKLPLTPQFDPDVSELNSDNAFWLKGIDQYGEVVQTQAVRLDRLIGISLAQHLKSLKAFYKNPQLCAHSDEICEVKASAAYGITGNVCYQGEFWLKKTPYRGTNLTFIMPRITMIIAMMKWPLDFMYATVNPGIIEKGVVSKYGYHNVQPSGIVWTLPRTGEVLDEWLIWMSWREIMDIIIRQ